MEEGEREREGEQENISPSFDRLGFFPVGQASLKKEATFVAIPPNLCPLCGNRSEKRKSVKKYPEF